MSYPFLQDFVREWTGLNLPLPIPMFGTFVALAVFAGYAVMKKELERQGNQKLADLITEFAFTATLGGMLGARLFHILEYPQEFLQDPWGMIFSRGGLTIYGGWICGTAAGIWFLRRRKFNVLSAADAAGPGMMLAYGIGRIGCQLAGDGDWGLPANMALKPEWLPTWLWAQTYTNNILGEVIPAPGVYPTPLYESLAAFALFGVLWLVRKHPFRPGWTFSFYLFLTGFERIWIEQIRVNSRYHIAGLQFTQAELISVLIMTVGLTGLVYFGKRRQ